MGHDLTNDSLFNVPASQGAQLAADAERHSIKINQAVLSKQQEIYKQNAGDIAHYPIEWWDKEQDRKNLLQIVGECLSSSDSEDDLGKPRFKESKCAEFQAYLRELKLKVVKQDERRKRVELEN